MPMPESMRIFALIRPSLPLPCSGPWTPRALRRQPIRNVPPQYPIIRIPGVHFRRYAHHTGHRHPREGVGVHTCVLGYSVSFRRTVS